VYGDGEQTRDYVFVRDVARANVLASEAAVARPAVLDDLAVNIGTAHETSVNELARTMMRAVGIDVPIEYAPARAGELMRSAVAVDKAATAIRWRPEVSLGEGLRRTYDWISAVEAA
jgi:UDP-glucose 4-epimerase